MGLVDEGLGHRARLPRPLRRPRAQSVQRIRVRPLVCAGHVVATRLLQGLSGARYDAVEKVLYLEPGIKGDFRCFLATATGYGTVGVRERQAVLSSRRRGRWISARSSIRRGDTASGAGLACSVCRVFVGVCVLTCAGFCSVAATNCGDPSGLVPLVNEIEWLSEANREQLRPPRACHVGEEDSPAGGQTAIARQSDSPSGRAGWGL